MLFEDAVAMPVAMPVAMLVAMPVAASNWMEPSRDFLFLTEIRSRIQENLGKCWGESSHEKDLHCSQNHLSKPTV